MSGFVTRYVGLVGPLTLVLVGCSEVFSSSSCKESRSCTAEEGTVSQAGALNGEGGDSDTAHGGGDEKGGLSDGGAGAIDQAEGGEDASGGQQDALLFVESIVPREGMTAVERGQRIEVVFSADIDQTSITAEAFSVKRAGGAVPGKLSVSGARATFTPNEPWALLSEYAVKLSPNIRSERGLDLPVPARTAFPFARETVFFRSLSG